MSAEQLRNEVLGMIRSQVSYWSSSNDISSPTNVSDIREEANKIDGLSDDDRERLIRCMEEVYMLVRDINYYG